MTLKAAIPTTGAAELFRSTSVSHDAGKASCDEWYVIRYKVLTRPVRNYLLENSQRVFFPVRKVAKRHYKTHTPFYAVRTCIPGYIFVRGPYEEAKKVSDKTGLSLWKRHFNVAPCMTDLSQFVPQPERLFYSVSDRQVKHLMAVVRHYQNDLQLFDATDIDLEQNDLVEFVSGDFQGLRGYIRMQQGKAGGLVIVPLTSDAYADDDREGEIVLHYGVEVKPDQIRIVRFANNARHNDCIKRAIAKVDALLQDYAKGKTPSEKQCDNLKVYCQRYSYTETTTHIQRARLALLFYRIYTILEDEYMVEVLRKQFDEEILPAYDYRQSSARGNKKQQIAGQKEKLIRQLSATEAAARSHRDCLTPSPAK